MPNKCERKLKTLGKKRKRWVRLGKPRAVYNGLIRDIKRCGWKVRITKGVWYIR